MRIQWSNRQAFLFLEFMWGVLFFVVVLSWMVLFLSQSSGMNKAKAYQEVAELHARYIFSECQGVSSERIKSDIQAGEWNFPNVPAIESLGLVALPGESIMTQWTSAPSDHMTVSVRWQNPDGQWKEIFVGE